MDFQAKIFKINSPQALERQMPAIVEALTGRRKITLVGEMGAGKTTFVRAFCQFLGVRDATASPTFSLVNEYQFFEKNGDRRLVRHLDLYRLKKIEEALDFGIEDFLEDENYCLIEWPDLIEPLLPPDTAKIQIEITAPNRRQIVVLGSEFR